MMTHAHRFECYISSHGPNDQKLLVKSEKAFYELIEQVRKISRLVNDNFVQEVSDFILDNLSLRIIEQQKPDTIFVADYKIESLSKNYHPNLPVVFFIERVNMYAPALKTTNGYAFYMRTNEEGGGSNELGNFIALRDPATFTPFFQAINFFHEAKHAFDHQQKLKYASLSSDQREASAHVVEIIIMLHFGGRKLLRLAAKHADRIKKKSGLPPEKCDNEIINQYVLKYDDELDRIFGKALSQREKNLRMDRLMFGFACNPALLEHHLK